jgi:hypothetical protein
MEDLRIRGLFLSSISPVSLSNLLGYLRATAVRINRLLRAIDFPLASGKGTGEAA